MYIFYEINILKNQFNGVSRIFSFRFTISSSCNSNFFFFLVRMKTDRSDSIRLALMWKFGGTYSDTDIFCNSKLPNDSMILALENPRKINNNFLKTTIKNHEFYFKALTMFHQRYNVSDSRQQILLNLSFQ